MPRHVFQYLGGGVRAIRSDETPELLQVDFEPAVLAAKFGAALSANLFRAFAGANRLISLLQFLSLSHEHLTHDGIAYSRNLYVGSLYIFGLFKELSGVFEDLNRCGIKGGLQDPDPWLVLHDIFVRWSQKNPSAVRNDLAHHLGWQKETTAAFTERAAENERWMLHEQDGVSHTQTRFTGGEDLLLAACDLETADFEKIYDEAIEDFEPLFKSLEMIAADLFRQCGASWR